MQIDTSNNIVFNVADNSRTTPKKVDPAQTEITAADASLTTEFEPVIQKSLETDSIDLQAVKQAQADLQNGTLDTPEAAETAAQNILDLGV